MRFWRRGSDFLEFQDIFSLVDLGLDTDFTSDDEISQKEVNLKQGEINPDTIDLEEDVPDVADEEELQEVNLNRAFFEESAENLEFPHLFIKGISTEEELKFYRARTVGKQQSIPVYTEVEGIPIKVMNTDLSLQFFLNLHFVSDYEVTLQRSEGDSIPIDLNNPKQLTKFIKL